MIIVLALALILLGLYRLMARSRQLASPEEIQSALKQGAPLVDVRTPEEFAADRLPGAINIPLQDVGNRTGDFGPQERPVVLFCNSGNRSGLAATKLERRGFSKVLNGGGSHRVREILS